MISDGADRPRVMLIVTAAVTARLFMRGYAVYLAKTGYDVTLVADDASVLESLVSEHGVTTRSLPMRRNPHAAKDLISLIDLTRLMRESRPDAVVYATPKASLLASIVALFFRVPVRVYELWGIRFETTDGLARQVLRSFERMIAASSTAIVANSRSLADRASELGIARRERIEVLGSGSSHGVDVARFSPEAETPALDGDTRRFVESQAAFTVGFVGRIHPDKGIDTVLEAVSELAREGAPVRLILVGREEGARDAIVAGPYVHHAGDVEDVRAYLRTFDVLVLMSLREGFPNVVLEAAAMGIPAIVSDATGCVDSVVDGVTGLIVRVGDSAGLRGALKELMSDPARRLSMARSARKRTIEEFNQSRVWAAAEEHLRQCLSRANGRGHA